MSKSVCDNKVGIENFHFMWNHKNWFMSLILNLSADFVRGCFINVDSRQPALVKRSQKSGDVDCAKNSGNLETYFHSLCITFGFYYILHTNLRR